MKDVIIVIVFLVTMYLGIKIDSIMISQIMSDISPANQYYHLTFYAIWAICLMVTIPIILLISSFIASIVGVVISKL